MQGVDGLACVFKWALLIAFAVDQQIRALHFLYHAIEFEAFEFFEGFLLGIDAEHPQQVMLRYAE